MQKELQQENDYEKKKKKTTKKTKRSMEEKPSWAFFEQRSRGKTQEQLKKLARDLIDETYANESYISLEDFCIAKRIHRQRLYEWDKLCEDIAPAREFTKQIIGMRREHDIYERKTDKAFLNFQSQFLDRYKEHNDYEDSRKIKLANEGVTNGETKIIVVNENKKYEEPE